MSSDIVFRIGGLTLTVYGLCVAVAMGAFIAVTCLIARFIYKSDPKDFASLFALIIPFGLIGARLVYCAVNWDRYFNEFSGVLFIWNGGLSLAGGAIFSALTVFIILGKGAVARRTADCLAPGAMLFISVIRAAEISAGQGIGKCVDTEFLQGGPFVMLDEYSEIRHAVYRWEALIAATLFAFAVWLLVKGVRKGRVAGWTWMLFCAFQVLLESLRDDDYLKWGYVRISQVIYFVALILLAAGFIVRGFKSLKYLKNERTRNVFRTRVAILTVAAVLGATLTVYQEFSVDTDFNLELNYLIMALGLSAIPLSAYMCEKLCIKAQKTPVRA